MARKTKKSEPVESVESVETQETEPVDAAQGLPGIEEARDPDLEERGDMAVAEDDGDDSTNDVKSEDGPDASTDEETGPKVYMPNLFALMYEGDEPYEFREAIRRPFPKIRKGDVVIVDRRAAKWLTRRGMPFTIVEDAIGVVAGDTVKRVGFFDAIRRMFG